MKYNFILYKIIKLALLIVNKKMKKNENTKAHGIPL